MKTDAKTMAEVLRKVADNIENGLDKNDGIQAMYGVNEWDDRTTNDLCFVEGVLYRIKPKTIIVNGVEIPKPLSKEDINHMGLLFYPALTKRLYDACNYIDSNDFNSLYLYKTKEEAIEASKKLFGIE